MESQPITIITGMTQSTTALEIHAAMIRLFLATILVMARIRWAQRLATTQWETRSGWRPSRNGSDVVTWIKATAHLPDTSSAWNGSLRLTPLAAARAIRLKLLTLPSTDGIARLRKVVRLAPCKRL